MFKPLTLLLRSSIATALLLLAGCDQLAERAGLVDPDAKPLTPSESQAVGGACRHAGRAIEDCYTLNPRALKDGVFAGWKEMNDYMKENNLEVVKPELANKSPARAEEEDPHAAKKAAQPKEPDKEDAKKAGSNEMDVEKVAAKGHAAH